MKKLYLLLMACWASFSCLAQTGDSTETFEAAPFLLRFESFEEPKPTGTLALKLLLEAQGSAATTYEGVRDDKEFFQFEDSEMRALAGGGKQDALSGGRATFYLKYDPAHLPFYPVRVQVTLGYTPAVGGPPRTYHHDCYVYFTPYNTVEVWDQTDYESLPRMWLTDDGQPTPRVAVDQAAIPVSDIPVGYKAAPAKSLTWNTCRAWPMPFPSYTPTSRATTMAAATTHRPWEAPIRRCSERSSSRARLRTNGFSRTTGPMTARPWCSCPCAGAGWRCGGTCAAAATNTSKPSIPTTKAT